MGLNASVYRHLKRSQGKLQFTSTAIEKPLTKQQIKRRENKNLSNKIKQYEFLKSLLDSKEFCVKWYNGFVTIEGTFNINKEDYFKWVEEQREQANKER